MDRFLFFLLSLSGIVASLGKNQTFEGRREDNCGKNDVSFDISITFVILQRKFVLTCRSKEFFDILTVLL